MNDLTTFFDVIKSQTIQVPLWQLLVIFAVAAICMIIRGSKMSLLITYIFTLNLAFSFFRDYFGTVTVIIAGICSAIILLVGIYETLTD